MIIYEKLRGYLKAKNMKWTDIQNGLGISPTVLAKLQKDRPCNTGTLDKICEFLNVQPGDIMEWVPDDKIEEAKIKSQIAELQKKLEQLQK